MRFNTAGELRTQIYIGMDIGSIDPDSFPLHLAAYSADFGGKIEALRAEKQAFIGCVF